MNTLEINQQLAQGDVNRRGVLPKLDELAGEPFVFRQRFGLDELPGEAGVILVRGARQYGKSTWLQSRIRETVEMCGPGSAFYLNGDEVRDGRSLVEQIRQLLPMFSAKAPVRRLFIDEITAVKDWTNALKALLDSGELRQILLVTTGSKAADLRHGTERLPGRKGRLARTAYIFTPLPFAEFKRVCAAALPAAHLLPAYLIAGGSPPACAALAATGSLPNYIIEMVRDWIYGEFAASGRSRSMLLGVLECLYRFAGTPSGQSKLAREAGLANNTVAAGYVEVLSDLMCVATAFAWEADRKRSNRRRPCKFHMTNLLASTAWHPRYLRTPEDFLNLPEEAQGALMEWAVAQECWRRSALRGEEMPELMHYWQGGNHEIDFVLGSEEFLEVKRGRTGPLDFAWFPQSFPDGRLTVVGLSRFETDQVVGVTLGDFLLEGAP
ncbi:MAG: ATP-binding protein [candidate division NC10 bacterium]|nr:ATP-binding protein [candidate division NC10 bacterium]